MTAFIYLQGVIMLEVREVLHSALFLCVTTVNLFDLLRNDKILLVIEERPLLRLTDLISLFLSLFFFLWHIYFCLVFLFFLCTERIFSEAVGSRSFISILNEVMLYDSGNHWRLYQLCFLIQIYITYSTYCPKNWDMRMSFFEQIYYKSGLISPSCLSSLEEGNK